MTESLIVTPGDIHPVCVCVAARSCGAPQDTAHGWHAGECYTYGCRVLYHCADGFELVGRNERTCQADGTWLPKELPACVRKLLT